MKNIIIIVLAVLLLGSGVWYFSTQKTAAPSDEAGEVDGAVVAIVNGEEISRASFNALQAQAAGAQGVDFSTLDASTQTQFESQIVDTLVAQALLRQSVADANVIVTDAQVDEQIETIKGQFEDEQAYEAALTQEGLTEATFREQIEVELATQAYLDTELRLSSITATDEEIDTAYEQLSVGAEDVPPLEEVRDQVEALVIQQKQQELVNNFIAELRSDADIEILL